MAGGEKAKFSSSVRVCVVHVCVCRSTTMHGGGVALVFFY